MINFPQKNTIHPQLVNISSPKKFAPKYVDLRALLSIVARHIYALFSANPLECQDWGAGGQANHGNARIFTASVTATPPLVLVLKFGGISQQIGCV